MKYDKKNDFPPKIRKKYFPLSLAFIKYKRDISKTEQKRRQRETNNKKKDKHSKIDNE